VLDAERDKKETWKNTEKHLTEMLDIIYDNIYLLPESLNDIVNGMTAYDSSIFLSQRLLDKTEEMAEVIFHELGHLKHLTYVAKGNYWKKTPERLINGQVYDEAGVILQVSCFDANSALIKRGADFSKRVNARYGKENSRQGENSRYGKMSLETLKLSGPTCIRAAIHRLPSN